MTKSVALPEACVEALADTMRPDFLKALCDPVRISIVATLAMRTRPATVSEITDCCGIDFSGVSRHLKILKEAGILHSHRDGRRVLYNLDVDALAATLRAMADTLEVCQREAV